jgi:hypothetical protein
LFLNNEVVVNDVVVIDVYVDVRAKVAFVVFDVVIGTLL